MSHPIITTNSKATRIAIFIALELFGMLFGIIFGVALIAISGVSTDSLNGIRISQICNQLFIFVLPPFLYAALTRPHPMKSLGFKKMPVYALLGIPIMFTILPFNSCLQSWNEQLSFPESIKALEEILRALQEQATAITEKMVSVNGISELVVNLIMMAGLAALGEELLFRAMLQPWLIRITKSPHIGIIITAIIFSATHLEIDGFLSRAVLGMALGYVFFYSGSLWSSITMHFVNNAAVVVLFFLNYNKVINVDVEKVGSSDNVFVIIGSFLATIILIVSIIIFSKRNKNQIQ